MSKKKKPKMRWKTNFFDDYGEYVIVDDEKPKELKSLNHNSWIALIILLSVIIGGTVLLGGIILFIHGIRVIWGW